MGLKGTKAMGEPPPCQKRAHTPPPIPALAAEGFPAHGCSLGEGLNWGARGGCPPCISPSPPQPPLCGHTHHPPPSLGHPGAAGAARSPRVPGECPPAHSHTDEPPHLGIFLLWTHGVGWEKRLVQHPLGWMCPCRSFPGAGGDPAPPSRHPREGRAEGTLLLLQCQGHPGCSGAVLGCAPLWGLPAHPPSFGEPSPSCWHTQGAPRDVPRPSWHSRAQHTTHPESCSHSGFPIPPAEPQGL